MTDGSIIKQLTVPSFPIEAPLVGSKPFELGRRASCKNLHNKQPPRFFGHRPLVKDRQKSDRVAGAVYKRNSHVAVDVALGEKTCLWKALQNAGGKIRKAFAKHFR